VLTRVCSDLARTRFPSVVDIKARLTRLVAQVREEATGRSWDTLYEALTPEQRVALDLLLEVPEGDLGAGAVATPASRASRCREGGCHQAQVRRISPGQKPKS
jgi:hypothetical protein